MINDHVHCQPKQNLHSRCPKQIYKENADLQNKTPRTQPKIRLINKNKPKQEENHSLLQQQLPQHLPINTRRKTPSSSKETLSDCNHQVEKIKEVNGKPTCDTANEGRSREGGGVSTRAGVNTGTLHTSMFRNMSRLKVIANRIWYNIDGGWSQIIKDGEGWRRALKMEK
ncbi:succinate dehydrogenase [ubiquinone] iron-sulfur subunit 3 [Pyrus ussuriensis x Pyrus communis]|uniref:Succinate dehydrogenase [ubiquinone] iron-sulfur subunit 3 n=1 Tax=Pyrus ussuriensis x Pyrus communis TaxID=2448454 RepID=A0A5N5GCI1_9ROSA|nr:succinate dehydrogenase [ubiquinone] iron-sulfur subunit 3 [Pyrus ussuriensis x Pyrus communis]